MTKNAEFDVLIEGAGPAGLACAIALADTNLKIGIIEKGVFPRDKTCGDALSLDITNQLKQLSPRLAENFYASSKTGIVKGVYVCAPNNESFTVDLIQHGKPLDMHISKRIDFDYLLYQEAKQNQNVTFFEGEKATAVEKDNDNLTISNKNYNWKGKIVIGAGGAHSLVAKRLAGQKMNKNLHAAGLRVYYENVHFDEKTAHHLEFYFFDDVIPGYLWVFPLGEGKANVGLGISSKKVSKEKLNIKEILNNAIEKHPVLKEKFKNAKALETIKGHGLPLGSKKISISGDRYILVGDAASLIDPMSGEGIANAIRSGRYAADQIKKAFDKNDFSASFMKQYDKRINKLVLPELRASRLMQYLFIRKNKMNRIVNKEKRTGNIQEFVNIALNDPKNLNNTYYFKMIMSLLF